MLCGATLPAGDQPENWRAPSRVLAGRRTFFNLERLLCPIVACLKSAASFPQGLLRSLHSEPREEVEKSLIECEESLRYRMGLQTERDAQGEALSCRSCLRSTSSVVTSTSSLWTTPRGMQRLIDGIGNSLTFLSLRGESNSSCKD